MARILDPYAITVREARAEDAQALTELALASKRSWGYSDALIDLWRDELTFTPQSITARTVLVTETDHGCVGVISIALKEAVAEVEDLWIHPGLLRKGLGRRLFELGVERARAGGAKRLVIVSDPHAEGFYRRMGAQRTCTVPSQPRGRVLPVLEMDVS